MAVSNQALYLSAQKFAVKDTWYFKRVPLADVDKKTRELYATIQNELMLVCKAVGIHTSEV